MKSFEELDNEFLLDRRLEEEKVKPEVYEYYLKELNEILEHDSSNIDALKLKYFILFCLEKFEESVDTCNQILRITPEDIEVLDFKASNLFQLSRYKEVVENCQRILKIDPKNKEALEQWKSASTMDDSLPKPPKSVLSKIIEVIVIVAILGSIVLFNYEFLLSAFALFK